MNEPEGTYSAFCRQTDEGFQLLLVIDGFPTAREANSWLCEMMEPWIEGLDLENPTGWIH
tara:strand:+ start:250 stop:429 length:180 start_codon:yes stop_codon:yes gene_type:complete